MSGFMMPFMHTLEHIPILPKIDNKWKGKITIVIECKTVFFLGLCDKKKKTQTSNKDCGKLSFVRNLVCFSRFSIWLGFCQICRCSVWQHINILGHIGIFGYNITFLGQSMARIAFLGVTCMDLVRFGLPKIRTKRN